MLEIFKKGESVKKFASSCLALFVIMLILTGCSNNEDKIYESFKCAKVAKMLNKNTDAEKAIAKAEPYLKDVGGSAARYAMSFSQRFADDLELQKYTRAGQQDLLDKTYKSGNCQSHYR